MAKRGRKTLFKEEMIKEGYRLGALGLTMGEIADFWNVRRQTLYLWAEKRPDFMDTIKRGRDEADVTVIQALLKEAKNGNVAGIIFWLKNRQPKKWRQKQEAISISVSAQANAEVKTNVLSGIKESDIRKIIELAEKLDSGSSPGGKNRISSSQF